jgi:predicted 3-demethylubiquinone-9 3-methyltransferase (glyoxalase superfamily)
MNKITPFLWFNMNGEEAIDFYKTVFKNVTVHFLSKLPDGKASTGAFEIEGQQFMFVNGGPEFKFNESISMFISCNNQFKLNRSFAHGTI